MDLGKLATDETKRKVTDIIDASFDARPMPSGNITRREVIRRVDIAKGIYLSLLNECGWSEQRILDFLPKFLVRGIDGDEPIPEWAKRRVDDTESAMWGAEAAGRVEPERRLSALAKAGEAKSEEPLIIVPGRNRYD